jgi:hypothetical protein
MFGICLQILVFTFSFQEKEEINTQQKLALKVAVWTGELAEKFSQVQLGDKKQNEYVRISFNFWGSIFRKNGEKFDNKIDYLVDKETEKDCVDYSKKLLDEIESGNRLIIPSIFDFNVGAIGTVNDGFEVLQVISKTEFLGRPVVLNKALDPVIVSGVNTDGLADGIRCLYKMCFEITRTKSYTTVLGAKKTVYVLDVSTPEFLDYTAIVVKKGLEKKAIERKNLIEKQKTELAMKAENEKKDAIQKKIKEQKIAEEKALINARASISKLVSGLSSYTKRYDDSFNESNPKLAEQMQEQALTYIKNGDKRLADAIKDVNASTLPDEEKAALIKQGTEALYVAKKKVGIK